MILKKSDIKEELFKATEMTLKCVPLVRSRIKSLTKKSLFIKENDGMKGIDYSIERISSGRIGNETERIALTNIERQEEIDFYIKEEEHKIGILDDAINCLDEIDRKIIRMRYFKGNDWFQIADELCYTDKQCRNRKDAAVGKITIVLYGEEARKDYIKIA